MQEVSQKWLDNQNRRTTYKSFVKITLYDRNGNEIETFENADIISFTMEEEVDYLNDNLPKYEINFTLDNHTGRFDVDYPPTDDNLYSKLNARNKVVVEIGYQVSEDETDIEWIKGGTYYLSKWKISNNSLTADFTAREWLYFITNEYKVDFINTFSISSAIQTVLSSSSKIKGFSDLSYSDYVVLDSSLSDYKTQGNADGNAVNSVVQLLATAGGCTMYFDRENRLHIENIDLSQKVQDYEINEFNSFEYPDITFDELLKEVYIDWSWYETSPSDLSTLKDNEDYQVLPTTHLSPTGSTYITIDNTYAWERPLSLSYTGKGTIPSLSTTEANNYLIDSTTFKVNDQTYTHYLITGFNASGDVATFTISCENNSRTFDANATLSLYLPYFVSFNSSSSLTISEETEGITEQIINNFVNNDDTADLVLLQTASYKWNRRIIECDFRADPRLDAMDIINIYKKYGGVEKAIVERVKYSWNGGMFNGEVRARNIEDQLEVETRVELEGITNGSTYEYNSQLTIYVYVCTYVNGVLYKKRLMNSDDSITFAVYSGGAYRTSNHQADGYFIMTIGGSSTYCSSFTWYVSVNGTYSATYTNYILYHTFKDASWSEINVVCSGGVASTLYSLGDSKEINGNTAYIVAFDHYYLTSNTNKTASICIGMNVPSSTEHYYYNNNNDDVYWNNCYLRTNTNHSYDMTYIYNTLDSDLQNIIQAVNTYYADSTDSSSGVQTISDTLFIPSVVEIYGDTNVNNSSAGNLKEYANIYVGEGYQLEAFEKLNLSSTSSTNISTYITNTSIWFRTKCLNYTSSGNYYAYLTSSNACSSDKLNSSSHSLFVLFNIGVKS